MKKRRLILSFAFLFALLVVGAVWGYQQGPFYRGKPYDSWLKILNYGDPSQTPAALEAVKEIGVKGLPRLVALLKAGENDIPVRFKYQEYVQTVLGQRVEETTAEQLHAWAGAGLLAMGSAAVPTLISLLSDPDVNTRTQAAHLLAQMGSKAAQALPALRKALQAKDEALPGVLFALAQIGPDAQAALPEMIQTLRDCRQNNSKEAPLVLAAIDKVDSNAKQTDPFVKEVWTEFKESNRLMVIVGPTMARSERNLRRR